MQSEIGKKLSTKYNIDTVQVDSIILIKDDKYFIKSDSILEILKDLPSWWRILQIGIILPKSLRDFLYDLIAKYRYKIFGKKDACPIPSDDVSDRFL